MSMPLMPATGLVSLSDGDRRGDIPVFTSRTAVRAYRRHGEVATSEDVVDSYERRENRQTLVPGEVKGLPTRRRRIRQARGQNGAEAAVSPGGIEVADHQQ